MREILIRLEDELYEQCKNTKLTGENEGFDFHIIKSVANGTVLPKKHGRLIDGDTLRKEILSWGMNDYEPSDFTDEIDMADVIIEADKEKQNDK